MLVSTIILSSSIKRDVDFDICIQYLNWQRRPLTPSYSDWHGDIPSRIQWLKWHSFGIKISSIWLSFFCYVTVKYMTSELNKNFLTRYSSAPHMTTWFIVSFELFEGLYLMSGRCQFVFKIWNNKCLITSIFLWIAVGHLHERFFEKNIFCLSL